MEALKVAFTNAGIGEEDRSKHYEDLSNYIKRAREHAESHAGPEPEEESVPVSKTWAAFNLRQEMETMRDMEFLRQLRIKFVSSGLAEKMGYIEHEPLSVNV